MDIITDPYTKSDLLSTLARVNQEVTESFSRIPADQFFASSPQGWSPGENLVHLIKSVSPVGKAMKLPRIALGGMFGTTKEGSVRYPELRQRYVDALNAGGQATGPYVPQVGALPPDPEQLKRTTLDKWNEVATRLAIALEGWSETDLDKYVLPHPLIGKLTIREMLFFTLYHNLLHANEARTFLGESALAI